MGLRENIFQDTVAQLSIRKPILVPPDTTVREAARQMSTRQLGCVLVVDQQGKPLGKFTQRQLMKALVENTAKLDAPVASVMYNDPDVIGLHEPIAKMVALMSDRQIRYLTVVDEQGKAVGLTGQKGLMEYIAEHFPRRIKVQRMKPLLSMTDREGA